MKITDIALQAKNPDRVNVSVDGTYRFSLSVYQLGELGLKIGNEYSQEQLDAIEQESQFGKLYARALEYCLMRPHSSREVKDYLFRKTRSSQYRTRSGEIKERQGVSEHITDRVFERLEEKGYINDEAFARFWVEYRHRVKGASRRKLQAELYQKGVSSATVDLVLTESARSDEDELRKVIMKKRKRYPDDQKLVAYLARQGFSFDDIKSALLEEQS